MALMLRHLAVSMYLKISQYVLAGLNWLLARCAAVELGADTYEHWNKVMKKQAVFRVTV